MKLSELIKAMEQHSDDPDIKIVIADGAEHLDELEPGSVLTIEDTGYSHVLRSPVIYVMPT